MKVLIVNKFLYPNGGSETYIFEIGKQLQKMGHEVQYFGMEHEGRIVGNRVNSYTSNMDFHTGKLAKLMYPFKIIYSREARQKIRKVLDDFKPDVVHLNNINFQITPSILYEIKKYQKDTGNKIKIAATAHDYQWICPNHMLYIPHREEICERCTGGAFGNCAKYKCIHGSFVKSVLGSVESYFYHLRKTYGLMDVVICPSEFMKRQLSKDKVLADKLIVMRNFVTVDIAGQKVQASENKLEKEDDVLYFGPYAREKSDYVLYFGRYAKEKGIETLLNACEQLPEISFVFAGSGPLEEKVNAVKGIRNVGFQNGAKLQELITKARFSIYPSEWYENCPFSIMESQMYGTPVIGADIGGIPELIQEGVNGELFETGNVDALKEKIQLLWNDKDRLKKYTEACADVEHASVEAYCERLLEEYTHER